MGTKESRFMRPIINRSTLQLNATNEAYIKVIPFSKIRHIS